MTDIKALFCPKCKGELSSSERFNVCHRCQDVPYYEYGYRCLTCAESHMVIDCLTEKQIKENIKLYPLPPDQIEESKKFWEWYAQSKQTPSFCFAEGEDGNKVRDQGDDQTGINTHETQVNTPKEGADQPCIFSSENKAEDGREYCQTHGHYGCSAKQRVKKAEECEHDFLKVQGDNKSVFCNKCHNFFKKYTVEEKPQSQIAIEKVIEALENAVSVMRDGKHYHPERGWLFTAHFFEQFITELKELNK